MRLRSSPTSPFARKVLAFAYEAGLADQIEIVPANVWDADTDIDADNPLGKVPVLITDDGPFIGSYFACEYLDSLHDGRKLIPFAPPQRWQVLQVHALADGVMEAAVARAVETLRRPKEFFSQKMADRQDHKIRTGLQALENSAPGLSQEPDIGTITLACTLSYLDLRKLGGDWRKHPAMARWYEDFAARPSMTKTAPSTG